MQSNNLDKPKIAGINSDSQCNYKTLKENIKNNDIDNIIPINMIMSDKRQTLKLQFKYDIFETEAAPLNDILNQYNMDFKKIEFYENGY